MVSKSCASAGSGAEGEVSDVVVVAVAGLLPSPLSRALSFRFLTKSMVAGWLADSLAGGSLAYVL